MNDVHDLDAFGRDTVDQDVVRMHDRFARAGDAAGAVDIRMLRQPFGTGFDGGDQASCGADITLGDIAKNSSGLFACGLTPDQPQDYEALRAAFLMIARISAITSSCGTGGRGSASDAATFSCSHAR